MFPFVWYPGLSMSWKMEKAVFSLNGVAIRPRTGQAVMICTYTMLKLDMIFLFFWRFTFWKLFTFWRLTPNVSFLFTFGNERARAATEAARRVLDRNAGHPSTACVAWLYKMWEETQPLKSQENMLIIISGLHYSIFLCQAGSEANHHCGTFWLLDSCGAVTWQVPSYPLHSKAGRKLIEKWATWKVEVNRIWINWAGTIFEGPRCVHCSRVSQSVGCTSFTFHQYVPVAYSSWKILLL